MSPRTEKILHEIRTLPSEEQIAISERLSEELVGEIPAPERVSVHGEADLKEKIRQGLDGTPIPITDQFWQELHDQVDERGPASV